MPLYDPVRDLLFKFSPETAHDLTIAALRPIPAPRILPSHDAALATVIAGIEFPTPLGLAAGFDKNAKAAGRMLAFGFGWVEVGTVTPRRQSGNAKPRFFRLEEDQAVINRFGFNSDGHAAVARRLSRRSHLPGIIGVNLGANKDSQDRVDDYVVGVREFSGLADYLTINISSPNTPGLRELQSKAHLSRLIERVIAARDEVEGPPLFLKISHDLSPSEVTGIARAAVAGGIDALIISNTTITRPNGLQSPNGQEIGGLSGRPLRELSLQALRMFRSELGSELPLIGAGGISSPEDAYERIRAGASLIQLYTAFAYQGPALISGINSTLPKMLRAAGLQSVSELVGTETPAEATASFAA